MKLIILLSMMSLAGQLGTNEQKVSFAQETLTELLNSRGEGYTLDRNSVSIGECEGALNKMGKAISNATFTGTMDCNTVVFRVISKSKEYYSGKMIITSEHKERRNLGLVKDQSLIPQLDLAYRSYVEAKTGRPFYMGIHATNSKDIRTQSASQLFDLKQIKETPVIAPTQPR